MRIMMDGKTYIVRSLKYLVWLLLLFTLVFTLMLATGTSRADAGRDLAELFGSSWRLFTRNSGLPGGRWRPILPVTVS